MNIFSRVYRLNNRLLLFRVPACVLAFLLVCMPLAQAYASEVAQVTTTQSDTQSVSASPTTAANQTTSSDTPPSSSKPDTATTNTTTPSTDDNTASADAASKKLTEDPVIDSTKPATASVSAATPFNQPNATQTTLKLVPSVDQSTGALTYEYPLTIPAGRNGMTPDIKLVYNSQQLDDQSPIGYGWHFSTPYIARVAKHGTDQLYTKSFQDFVSSSGGELVQTSKSDPKNNQEAGTYAPTVEKGDFLTYNFDGTKWTLVDKTGTIYTYGRTTNSIQSDPNNASDIYKWMLEEIRDTNDNYISYTYTHDQGQIYPATITYTNNPTNAGIFTITFTTTPRTGAIKNYTTGFAVTTALNLDAIAVSVNGIQKKKYQFAYGVGDNTIRTVLKSVQEVDMTTGVSLPPTTFSYTTNRATPASALGFTALQNINSNIKLNGCSIGTQTQQFGGMPCGAQFADINGDGLPDYVASAADFAAWGTATYDYTERVVVYLNQGNGTFIASNNWVLPTRTISSMNLNLVGTTATHMTFFDRVDAGGGISTSVSYNSMRLVDVNGDGKADIVWQDPQATFSGNYNPKCREINPWKVYINNGHGWTYDSTWTAPFDCGLHPFSLASDITQFVDVNGDGYPDIYVGVNDLYYGGLQQEVFLNNHKNGWNQVTWPFNTSGVTIDWPAIFHSPGGESGFTRFADINGDGLPDLVVSIRMDHKSDGSSIPDNRRYHQIDLGEWQYVFINTGSSFDYDATVSRFPANNMVFTKSQIIYPTPPPNVSHVVFTDLDEQYAQEQYRDRNYVNNFFDFNGDGQTDLLDGNTVYLSHNGAEWDADPFYSQVIATNGSPATVSTIIYDNSGIMIDLNGDGMLDIMNENQLQNSTPYIRLNQNKPTDILSSVTLSQGAVVAVTYKPSAQYADASGNLLNPNLPLVINTVSSITTTDPVGNISGTTSYVYANAAYYFDPTNPDTKKFAGFGLITATDPVGNITKTYYHTGSGTDISRGENADSLAKIGEIYRIEKYNSGTSLYSVVINKWDDYKINTNQDFVKCIRTTTLTYDGTGSHRDTAQEFVYDNTYGNVTQKIDWGEVVAKTDGTFIDTGTDKALETISYACNANNYVVGLLSNDSVVDQNGNKVRQTRTYYDGLTLGTVGAGNPTKVEQWKSGTTYIASQKTYNTTYGIVVSSIDERGKITTYTYDQYNLYPVVITDPLFYVTQYIYDYVVGKPLQTTDPNHNVWTTTYDAFGRIIQENIPDPNGGVNSVMKTTYVYTDTTDGVSVHKTDYLNASTSVDTYQYFDGLGRRIQERKEAEIPGNVTISDTMYSNRGLVQKQSIGYAGKGIARTTPMGVSSLFTVYIYDPLQRVVTISNALGTTSYAYRLWKTTVTDANGKIKNYYTDAYGNLVRVDELNVGSTYTTVYMWDLNTKLTSITDALGNIRNFTYDGLGRRLTAEDLHAPTDLTYGTWTYTYDNAGNISQSINPLGQIVTFTYDDLNRVTSEDYTGATGVETKNVYDTCTNGIGKLCISTVNNGATSMYSYDALGNIATDKETINAISSTTSYNHDQQGNTTLITYPDNAQVRYTFNTAGLLEKIERKESGGVFTDVVSNFDYNPIGEITTQQFPNGVTTTNTYDTAKLYRLINKTTSSLVVTSANTTPVIVLSGAGLINKTVGDTWTEPGYKATDAEDGDLTSSVKITGSVNMGSAGVYQLVYTVVDSAGAPAAAVVRTVAVHTLYPAMSVKALVIGGGGSGGHGAGTAGGDSGGGGGAGGYQYNQAYAVIPHTYSVTVGSGGPSDFRATGGGKNGSDSVFDKIIAKGGGFGGANEGNGLAGGSGGGASGNTSTCSASGGRSIEGNAGGNASSSCYSSGAGGGGAGLVGANNASKSGGNGGDGIVNSISGTSVVYGGGGGGGGNNIDTNGKGGAGGGGNGSTNGNIFSTSGIVNTGGGGGGGGGGGTASDGAAGGSGIVIISYKTDGSNGLSPTSTGGVITNSGGYTIHTFTKNGTFTPVVYVPPVNTNPVIALNGQTLINKTVGDTWVEPGYKATDVEDGDLTSSVKITGAVTMSLAGTYQLLYAVVDSKGAPAQAQVRTIVVHPASSQSLNYLQNLTYTYDNTNNITSITDASNTASAKTATYVYDDLYRLISATATGVPSDQTLYTQTFTYNPIGDIMTSPVGTYSYAGNTGTSKANPHAATSINGVTNTYDADGNVLTDGTLTNAWNYKDQLTQVVKGKTTITYSYDYQGNRVRAQNGTVNTYYPNKYYSYDGTTKTKNIYAGTTLVANITTAGTTVTPYYIHTDHLGSTNVTSNSTGAITQTLDYYPYGSERISTGTTTTKRHYIGELSDTDTGLDYLNARYYNSTQGRFISEDPQFWGNQNLMDPQSFNSYSYARDNPVNLSDPTGRNILDTIWGAVNAFVSNEMFGVGRTTTKDYQGNRNDYAAGQRIGDSASIAVSKGETEFGLAIGEGGVVLTGSGAAALAGVPAALAGATLTAHGITAGIIAAYNFSVNDGGGNNVSTQIDEGQQGKHVVGHNNYDPSLNRSILTEDPQSLLDDFHSGNIESSRVVNENKTNVDFGKNIGTYKTKDGTVEAPTTNGTIHNGKNGAHIVPARPN